MYLIFPTEEDAYARAEEEGKSQHLSFYINGVGSRYVTAPEQTVDGLWALDVETYDLDEGEQATTTVEVIFLEPKEDI